MPQPVRTSDISLYLRLLRYLRPYWRVFAASLLGMVVLAATAPLVAAILKPVMDEAFIARDADMIRSLPLYLVLLFAIRGIASYISVVALNSVANRVIMDLRVEMFRKVLTFPSMHFDRVNAGAIISRFTYDVTQIRQAATETVTTLCRDSLYTAGLLGWMFYVNWRMASVTVIAAPLITLAVIRIRRRIRQMNRRVQDSMADIHHALGEVIHGHRMVKLFGGHEQETERFAAIANNNRKFSMKAASAAAASSPAVEMVTAVALALVIFLAGREALAGALSVGGFVSFFGAAAMVLPPVKRLVAVNEHLQRGLAACESVFGLLDAGSESDSGQITPAPIRGVLEVRDLRFRYEGAERDAVSGISLRVEPGQTVAVVGASGSGKTTISHLLPRFYNVARGSIFIDGVDIDDIPLSALRGCIGLVSQDVVLFNDSVRNNIAYGEQRHAGDTEVIAAARAANAMEFIERLPEGLATHIGEHGARLSGGQRQRIALARALLKDAPILILDEATSALDTESERKIQSALEQLRGRKTCIIIAHRLSTIAAADRIVVLEHGKVVQDGTHAELLACDGQYARLHQAAG